VRRVLSSLMIGRLERVPEMINHVPRGSVTR
jgi:hypothetical protein